MNLEIYQAASGRYPFDNWFRKIRDKRTRAQVLTRLDRLELGNFGDHKSLGNGLAELRIHSGSGIRVYYTKIGNTVVLLLCGGTKGSQAADIIKAREYLEEYRSRKEKHEKQ